MIRYLPHKITTLYNNYVSTSINVTGASEELRLRKLFRKLESAICKYHINGMLCHQFDRIMCLGRPAVAILNVGLKHGNIRFEL